MTSINKVPLKPLGLTDGNRNPRQPACANKIKNKLARVCTDANCSNNKSVLMCGGPDCACNKKLHKQCSSSISFNYLNSVFEDINMTIHADLFAKLLASLKSMAERIVKFHNKLIIEFDTYMYCEPLKDCKEYMLKNQCLDLKQSQKLNKLFTQIPNFRIPTLRQEPEYVKRVKKIAEMCEELSTKVAEFEVNTHAALRKHEELSVDHIMRVNLEGREGGMRPAPRDRADRSRSR